jgi:hypothetical protein
MSVKFESFEFDGKKTTVKTGEEDRKAFSAAIRKHRKPMTAKQRYDALMQAFQVSCRSREQFALRMRAALAFNDRDLIKKVAQQWVNYELLLVPPLP